MALRALITRRARSDRDLSQFRTLVASRANHARPDASVEIVAVSVVRHAEYPFVHGGGLRCIPRGAQICSARPCRARRAQARAHASQPAWRARNLSFPARLEP